MADQRAGECLDEGGAWAIATKRWDPVPLPGQLLPGGENDDVSGGVGGKLLSSVEHRNQTNVA